jgi:hypothetical protein
MLFMPLLLCRSGISMWQGLFMLLGLHVYVCTQTLGELSHKEESVCQAALLGSAVSALRYIASVLKGIHIGVGLSCALAHMLQRIHSNAHLSSLGCADRDGFVVLQCLTPEV